jgi:diguanylate cyclase (GGDEF)-like protein/PAS domain S-box-containing protein
MFFSGGLMRDRRKRAALRISVLYAFFAAAWILLSDRILVALVSDSATIGRISTFKGWVFVAVTALLLYGVLRNQLRGTEKQADERVKAEQSLRESEARFSAVFRASPVGISLSTIDDGMLVDINQAYLNILGYTHEQVVGCTAQEAGVWADPGERERFTEVICAGGSVRNAEVRIRNKSGGIRYVLASMELISLSGQGHLLTMMQDITERKEVEDALRESENIFRDLAEKSVLGISLIQDGFHRYVNARFAEIHGLTVEEMTGQPATPNMVPLADRPRVTEQLERCFTDGPSELEFGIVGKTGEKRTVLGYIVGTMYRGRPAKIATLLDITGVKKVEERVRQNEVRLLNAMDLAKMVYWDFDTLTKELILNDAFYALYGTTAEQEGGYRMSAGEYAARFVHPDDVARYYRLIENNPATNAGFMSDMEHRIVRRDGEVRTIIATVRIVVDGSGPPKLYGANQDITGRKEVEETLTWKTAFLEAQVNSSLDGILVIDSQGKTLLRNRAFVDMWKLPQGIADARDERGQWRHTLSMVVQQEAFREKVRFLHGNPRETARYEVDLKDGTILDTYSCPVLGKDGTFYGRIWTYRDITELKRYWAMLESLSTTDGLTELPNRRRFDEFLSREWRRAMRLQAVLSLVLLDIDCFKEFNDHYGHLAGDDCLRQVAQILREVVQRPGDLAARYGGEEFACILPETDSSGAVALAERIRERMEAASMPHFSSPVADHVTISFGVATTIPEPLQKPSDLIRLADRLLYAAKQNGRDQVRCWQRGSSHESVQGGGKRHGKEPA